MKRFSELQASDKIYTVSLINDDVHIHCFEFVTFGKETEVNLESQDGFPFGKSFSKLEIFFERDGVKTSAEVNADLQIDVLLEDKEYISTSKKAILEYLINKQ